jgi:hypothetical protein
MHTTHHTQADTDAASQSAELLVGRPEQGEDGDVGGACPPVVLKYKLCPRGALDPSGEQGARVARRRPRLSAPRPARSALGTAE